MSESMSLKSKDHRNWWLEILGAFVVTVLASIYTGYFLPTTHPALYVEAIFIAAEALTFLFMGRVFYDSY